MRLILSILLLVNLGCSLALAEGRELVPAQREVGEVITKGKRIVFLGDSITASGQYIGDFQMWLLTQQLDPLVIDAGLSSETVSGLSEEGHAGGKFPRPHLMDRIDRVIALTKPDVVIACYGINCGIYEPFDSQRFKKYQTGMTQLREKVLALQAKFIVITPPFFDDLRAKKKFSYNEVLDRYSEWLVAQREHGWMVIDLHSAMTKEVLERRRNEPAFTLQPDAVHPNAAGQWLIAQVLIETCGDADVAKYNDAAAMLHERKLSGKLPPLVQQRLHLLRDAYVHAAGHKRPGVAPGLPLEEAEAKASAISQEIRALLMK